MLSKNLYGFHIDMKKTELYSVKDFYEKIYKQHFSKPINFLIYNVTEKTILQKHITTINFDYKTYKLFTDQDVLKLKRLAIYLNKSEENFNNVISNMELINYYRTRCINFDEYNNNMIDYHYFENSNDTGLSLSKVLSLKLVDFLYKILNDCNLFNKYFTYMSSKNNYVYVSTYYREKSVEENKRKIHLMVEPKYHIFTIILLIIGLKDEKEFVMKTDMNYYTWSISYNENEENNKYIKKYGRPPSIIIYTSDIDDFIVKMNKIKKIFNSFSHIIGLNKTPSLNIKINELIYYGIETRIVKMNNINELKKDCNNVKNHSKFAFSEHGKTLWDNCSKMTTETCENYSNSYTVNRFSYGNPICLIENGKCIPRPLESCNGQYFRNKEELNKNEHLCTDMLCLQDKINEDNISIIESKLQL